jgi:hypothetical protein
MWKIRVRYKYHYFEKIETSDYGSFSEMYAKYGSKYTYWCADLPPEYDRDNGAIGYRLDGDARHIEATLKKYGKHKAWIDSRFKFEGKDVILVHNAGTYRNNRVKRPSPGSSFSSPKLRRRKSKSRSSASQAKSPLLQHFFFWVVVLSMFMGIFGFFQAQIESVVLWDDFYTLFGIIPYWTATIGWTITIMVAMCVDMVMVAE